MAKYSLTGKIFPPSAYFPLKLAFPFPCNALFFPRNEGFEEREFYGLREQF